jgi:hypothetical protein
MSLLITFLSLAVVERTLRCARWQRALPQTRSILALKIQRKQIAAAKKKGATGFARRAPVDGLT